jgi:putative endonuclease
METHGYIYFMTNRSNSVLYVGVTESLVRRVSEHAAGQGSVFTAKYNCHKLVYYEVFQDIVQAIAREKQLKHYNREWKNQLVDKFNPSWNDLAIGLADDPIA